MGRSGKLIQSEVELGVRKGSRTRCQDPMLSKKLFLPVKVYSSSKRFLKVLQG